MALAFVFAVCKHKRMEIREHITANGLSRAHICAAVGISRGMLSLIESGQRRIGVEKAAAFAAVLGLPVATVRPDLAQMFSLPQKPEDAA